MLDVQPATTTTTIIKQITSTTTTILGGTVPTKTDTFTISKTTSIAGATIPARTLYSTSTSTILSTTWTSTTRTSTSITTYSTTSTSTSTSITTSTQTWTRTLAPCDPDQWGRTQIPGGGKPSNARVVQGYARPAWPQNANNEQLCCSDCFVNPYCVFWAMPTDGTQCKFFIANDDNYECATEQCPRGYPVLDLNSVADGWVYHPGNCGNKWRQAVSTVI